MERLRTDRARADGVPGDDGEAHPRPRRQGRSRDLRKSRDSRRRGRHAEDFCDDPRGGRHRGRRSRDCHGRGDLPPAGHGPRQGRREAVPEMTRYRLIGSTASPYAIKLRALMRYRRIPFDWVIMTKTLRKQTEHLRPNLIPVLQYPDGTFRGETTALAYDLEARYSERSVIPQDKAVAFVCDLLEDLADEWAVKPLFLYRWWDAEDQAYVSRWAGQEWSTSEAATGSAEEIDEFRRRQISRMPILGATAENRPLLEIGRAHV